MKLTNNFIVNDTTKYSTDTQSKHSRILIMKIMYGEQVVTRTYTASIRNHSQVQDDLDALGFGASKLWNVGRWVCDRVWSEIGHIPGHNELTSYLKSHERYDDLHSQSSSFETAKPSRDANELRSLSTASIARTC